jgi:hypothetical protein
MKLLAIASAIILGSSSVANAIPVYKSVSGNTNDGRQYMIDLFSITIEYTRIYFRYKLVTSANKETRINVGSIECNDESPSKDIIIIAIASNPENISQTKIDSGASRNLKKHLCNVLESAHFADDYDFNTRW